MKHILIFSFCFLFHQISSSQGCVAIRSNGSSCLLSGADHKQESNNWVMGLNHRYFRSYKHFVKTEEQKHRVKDGTEVINYSNVFEIGITRNLSKRWSLAFFMPVISNVRTSMYEHTGNTRHATTSFGLGDVRLAAYRWMVNPSVMRRANAQLGLGIKLPTGDYRYQDFFVKNDSTQVLGPVDQSIQLGDGGTGITLEVNSFFQVTKKISLYANGFYLSNPREHNGVSTARGGTPSAANVRYGSHVMSVPDQYMLRAGGSMQVRAFTLSAGARYECLPAEDLIGGSNGFRRPGYVLSAEPVASFKAKRAQFYASVPVALLRSRIQSVPDKIRSRITGVSHTGDAAFADYSINIGASFALGK